MAGRPRKKDKQKNRSRNGTGTVTSYYQKVDKKENRSSTICQICRNCTHQELCNYRKGTDKCDKCKKCTNVNNCDRFYMYPRNSAYTPQKRGQKRKYLGSYENKKEAQTNIDKAKNGGFVDKTEVTVADIVTKIENNKYNANDTVESTLKRNMSVVKKLCKYGLGNLKVQNVTVDDVQEYLNKILKTSSQSEIEKNVSELQQCFKYAKNHKMILDNPFDSDDYIPVTSNKKVKIAEPFTFEQKEILFNYLDTEENLTDIRSSLDSITFKNVVKLAFYTGQRIGELLGLIVPDVSFEEEYFGISKIATREHTLREGTKNSKKRLRRGLPLERKVGFNYAPPDVIKNIFKEQIEHSKNIKGNKLNLVFCNMDGSVISSNQVTNTLKVICENLGIRPKNYKHCHIHQARHSFVVFCLEAHLSIEVIADLIGDEVREVQETYSHILPEYQQEELGKLHNYYQRKTPLPSSA